MNQADFQALAIERLDDAKALLLAGRYSGAYYVAGYVVECALKACYCKSIQAGDFPPKDTRDIWTHGLRELLRTAGLEQKQKSAGRGNELGANWGIACNWSEKSRYEKTTQAKAEAMYKAVSDPNHGVLQWLQTYW